jgi:SAM-dependent methyltransferase
MTSSSLSVTEITHYNRQAWDVAVERSSQWTVPVDAAIIAAARQGDWSFTLTIARPVPRAWFPPLTGADVLCLAGAGGQQGPILAAAGAHVTVFDNSPQQLAQDRYVARREGLEITTLEGDMLDLSIFADGSFDLIVHPCSNLFVPDVRPVWREAFRVLRPGGVLISGFANPVMYIFDQELADNGVLQVRHRIPYSDLTSLNDEERAHLRADMQPLEFGHTLEDQIGGQTDAGFAITGFYEDGWPDAKLNEFLPTFIATRAVKPGRFVKS